SRGLRDVGEGAIAVVVKQAVGKSLVVLGVAVGAVTRSRVAAERVHFRIPDHVMNDKEVQKTIVIVVEPAGCDGPRLAALRTLAQARLSGELLESAVAPIVVEKVAIHTGHKQIHEAVIVKISCGDAHPVSLTGHPGLEGYVCECTVAVV